jgi:hypothetical protein
MDRAANLGHRVLSRRLLRRKSPQAPARRLHHKLTFSSKGLPPLQLPASLLCVPALTRM